MKFEIISKNPNVEEALKQITAHNDEEFLKAGFYTEYIKGTTPNGSPVYYLIFKFVNPVAKVGMTNPLGRNLMLKSMKDKLKEIDKNVVINYIKGE